MNVNTKNRIYNLVLSAMFLSLCLLAPWINGRIPEVGQMLSIMHIPVFLCAFFCKWQFAAVVGAVAPLLSFVISQMPPFPNCIAMSFELCTYAFAAGILYKILPKKNLFIYVSLLVAMVAGRLVGGAATFIIAGINNTPYTVGMFFTAYFAKTILGIVIHILLIPIIVMSVKKAISKRG